MPAYGGLLLGAKSPKFTVRVTQKHIDDAIECDAYHCMIADAVTESFPGKRAKRQASYVSVDLQTIRFSDLDKRQKYRYLTPRRVQKMILDFDAGRKDAIKPMTFTIEEGQVYATGWRAQRAPSSKRTPSRTPTGPRKTPMPPQMRRFGLCLFQGHKGRHNAAEA